MMDHFGPVDDAPHLLDEDNRELTSSYASASASPSSELQDQMVLVEVSTPLLLLTMSPLLLVMYISFKMELSLEKPIVIGAVRTFVQLSILGMILQPIFVHGETNCWLVFAYVFLMVLLAARESMHRSKYKFPGMFLAVLAAMGASVLWVSLFAFVVILKPTPVWEPQYVIPIVGMLLGNCINGNALSLNSMLTALVEQSREIELYLSFGATPREAASRLMHEAVRVGAMPQLNSMAIIGLISIPGMMTGQILGGSPVREAARYQMLIMYLIATCTFGAILAEVNMALRAGFDTADRLRTDYFVDSKSGAKRAISWASVWSSFCRMCCCCFNGFSYCNRGILNDEDRPSTTAAVVPVVNGYDTESTGLLANGNPPATSPSNIEFRMVRSSPSEEQATACQLTIHNLSHSFAMPDEEEDEGEGKSKASGKEAAKLMLSTEERRRVLFEDLSLELKAGEMVLISGDSGGGKSTFVRLVAGLEPMVCAAHNPYGSVRLLVKDDKNGQNTYDSQRDRTLWRNQVRYVPQVKVDLPGTPKKFIQRITSLQAFNHNRLTTTGTIIQEVRQLLQAWGMDAGVALEKEWSTLSGGEAQRVIVAIGMASRPRVLLLDESTSALDLTSKVQVERSVIHYCQTYGTIVLWITHDPEQMKRLSRTNS